MYPYNFGSFVYYFSRDKIGKQDLQTWLSRIRPNLFKGIDNIYSAMNNYETHLIQKDDFVIVTSYDCQNHFGISANSKILELIKDKIASFDVTNIEFQQYKQAAG